MQIRRVVDEDENSLSHRFIKSCGQPAFCFHNHVEYKTHPPHDFFFRCRKLFFLFHVLVILFILKEVSSCDCCL